MTNRHCFFNSNMSILESQFFYLKFLKNMFKHYHDFFKLIIIYFLKFFILQKMFFFTVILYKTIFTILIIYFILLNQI